MASIPVLDMSPERCSHELALELKAAASTSGFFVVHNHGVSTQLIDQVYQGSRSFFLLDEAAKTQILASDKTFGYTAWGNEKLDPVAQKEKSDTKEAFTIFRPVGAYEAKTFPNPIQGQNQWPGHDERFKGVMLEYFEQIHRLALRLVELVAVSLGLPRFGLHSYFTRPIEVMRLLHYGTTKSIPEEGLFGAGAHTDYGFLTILSTDGCPGLEVLVGGDDEASQWVPVKPHQHDFVVNVGDFLHELTDGRFKSAKHRVISNGLERFSIPFFFEPNFETPMRKPYWDGDDAGATGHEGMAYYSYGEHLMRKYLSTSEQTFGSQQPTSSGAKL